MAKSITPPKEFFWVKMWAFHQRKTIKSCHRPSWGFHHGNLQDSSRYSFRGVGVSCNPMTWGFCWTWYCLMLQKSGTHQLIYGNHIYHYLRRASYMLGGWDPHGDSSPSLAPVGKVLKFETCTSVSGPNLFRGEKKNTTDMWWCIVIVCLFGVAFCLWSSTIYII